MANICRQNKNVFYFIKYFLKLFLYFKFYILCFVFFIEMYFYKVGKLVGIRIEEFS